MLKNKVPLFIFISFLTFTSCTDNHGYKTSPNGLQYKIVEDNKKSKAQPGQYISYHVFWRTMNDSLLLSSETANRPQISLVSAPQSKGDPAEIFTYLGSGDSASCQVPARTVFKAFLPANMKPDELMKIDFKVISVLSQQQVDSIQQESVRAQFSREDQALQTYMRKNGLTGSKTPTGLYVVMEKEGTGKQAASGNTVKVGYTGRLLDGTQFDSSHDPGHEPYEFQLGSHGVIEGWEEGLTYFKKGGEGKLLIPSRLGYGERGNPPKIGPNEALVFDIQLLEIK